MFCVARVAQYLFSVARMHGIHNQQARSVLHVWQEHQTEGSAIHDPDPLGETVALQSTLDHPDTHPLVPQEDVAQSQHQRFSHVWCGAY